MFSVVGERYEGLGESKQVLECGRLGVLIRAKLMIAVPHVEGQAQAVGRTAIDNQAAEIPKYPHGKSSNFASGFEAIDVACCMLPLCYRPMRHESEYSSQALPLKVYLNKI